jgi:trehalose 6-phosphate phosphatase
VAGIVLDFDGTLAEIVSRPELARPVEGAREALAGLAARYRLVAIVTGRASEDVAALLAVPHVELVGLYGFEEAAPELVTAVVPRVEEAAALVPEAWVEDKGPSIAIHYRQAGDPKAARAALLVALQPVATEAGLDLIEGKMVVELVPPGRSMKGAAVERLVGEHALEAVLYAGDDHADLDAFAALERLAAAGTVAVRVAVHGDETPAALIDAADLVCSDPAELVGLLRSL